MGHHRQGRLLPQRRRPVDADQEGPAAAGHSLLQPSRNAMRGKERRRPRLVSSKSSLHEGQEGLMRRFLSNLVSGRVLWHVILAGLIGAGASIWQAHGADPQAVPNFAPNPHVGWVLDRT